jgi:hypothetical protein
MSKYYSACEVDTILVQHPEWQEKLYCRGFVFTNADVKWALDEYPFYSNWRRTEFGACVGNCFNLFLHKDALFYSYSEEDVLFFLIGHAYNPYSMKWEESNLLKDLAEAYRKGLDELWDVESEFTGVFCIGYVTKDKLVYSTDCTGMQIIYYCTHQGSLYVSSHSKLLADFLGFEQTDYIRRLTNTWYWHFWGTYLPGDLSPYQEIKRTNPNCCIVYESPSVRIDRYYPTKKIEETTTQEDYQSTIHELGRVMCNTMELISKKWPDKTAALSLTGGRDSLTTLACSHNHFDQFDYFSYISNSDESVDAFAAREICDALKLKHKIIEIPADDPLYRDLNVFKMILECNSGCVGETKENEIRKRMYFCKHPPCGIEVKSWVNELGRGWFWNKFNKKKFPDSPTASYLRALYKVHFYPRLIKETDQVYTEYMKTYLPKEIIGMIPWVEQFYWECGWSASEGQFLTAEHRMSYDITIPFNNRKYVEKMLTVPLEMRKVDRIPIDLIQYEEPRISATGINIHDVSHTNFRAEMLKVYLAIFSKVRF